MKQVVWLPPLEKQTGHTENRCDWTKKCHVKSGRFNLYSTFTIALSQSSFTVFRNSRRKQKSKSPVQQVEEKLYKNILNETLRRSRLSRDLLGLNWGYWTNSCLKIALPIAHCFKNFLEILGAKTQYSCLIFPKQLNTSVLSYSLSYNHDHQLWVIPNLTVEAEIQQLHDHQKFLYFRG